MYQGITRKRITEDENSVNTKKISTNKKEELCNVNAVLIETLNNVIESATIKAKEIEDK